MSSASHSAVLSRRQFLVLAAAATTTGVLAACAAPVAAPTTGGQQPAEANIPLVVWYQDWDGANRIMNWVKPEFEETHPNVTVNLEAIGYSDLLAKLLPSIAAGTEGDVMMMYTDWVVATDISRVFLDITEPVGGLAVLQAQMWPAAFEAVDAPDNKIFYLPWLAGVRGAAMTVNTAHLEEKGIDYLNFATFEDVVEAGKQLTERGADGKITRSGYSPRTSQYPLMWSLIWQLGGEFYDRENGLWNFATDEAEQAAQILYDLYWTHQVCDFELFTSEFEAVSQQLVSIWGDGAWTASVQNNVAQVPTDNIATPPLANAVEYVLYPQHIGGWGLSRRLTSDPNKLDAGIAFAMLIVSPGALLQALEFYSGVTMSKDVYNDPRISEVKFGLMSKRVAETMWPVARYPKDRVAQMAPAATELDRGMRGEISLREALANMQAYLQEQEDQARERIG